MKIQKITIQNFKKISSASIELSHNLQLLAGPNNSGKSSLIQGIILAYQALNALYENGKIDYEMGKQDILDIKNKIIQVENKISKYTGEKEIIFNTITKLKEDKAQLILNARSAANKKAISQKIAEKVKLIKQLSNSESHIDENLNSLNLKLTNLRNEKQSVEASIQSNEELFVKAPGKKHGISVTHFPFTLSDPRTLFNVDIKANGANITNENFCEFQFDNGKFIKLKMYMVSKTFSIKISDCSLNISKNDLNEFISKPILLIPSFFSIVIDEERKSPARYSGLLKSGNYNQLFRNILLDLVEKDKQHEGEVDYVEKFKILNEITKDIFNINDLTVNFDSKKDEFIDAFYNISPKEGNKKKFDISTLGMGTLQFIQVFAQILADNATLILLDEPDAHLHAELQSKIIDTIQKLTKDTQTKFIISTHSTNIINRINPNQTLTFNDQGELKYLDNNNDLVKLVEYLGVSSEEILGVSIGSRVVFVEGDDDLERIKLLYTNYKGEEFKNNFNMVKFIPLNGREKILKNQVLELLGENFLSSNDYKKLIVMDRDYRPSEIHDKDCKKLEDVGFKVVGWKLKEFENYFIKPQFLAPILIEAFSLELNLSDVILEINRCIDNVYENNIHGKISRAMSKYYEDVQLKEFQDETNEKVPSLSPQQLDEISNKVARILKPENTSKISIISGKEVLESLRNGLLGTLKLTSSQLMINIINHLNYSELPEEINILLQHLDEISK